MPYKKSSKISTFGKRSKSSLKELNFKKIIFSLQRQKNARQPQETTAFVAFVVFEKFSFENLSCFDTPPRLSTCLKSPVKIQLTSLFFQHKSKHHRFSNFRKNDIIIQRSADKVGILFKNCDFIMHTIILNRPIMFLI